MARAFEIKPKNTPVVALHLTESEANVLLSLVSNKLSAEDGIPIVNYDELNSIYIALDSRWEKS